MTSVAQRLYAAVFADDVLAGMLKEDPEDAAEPTRFYARGTLGREGVPASPGTPYTMYGDSGSSPDSATKDTSPDTGVAVYTFYVYDQPGSFERIKDIIREIRRVVQALTGTTTEEGMIVTEAAWTSTGKDEYDAVSKNNVKTVTFRIVGRV